MQWIVVIDAENIEWVGARTADTCVAWCEELRLSARAPTHRSLMSAISEELDQYCRRLLRQGRLLGTMSKYGWRSIGDLPLRSESNNVMFDVQFDFRMCQSKLQSHASMTMRYN